MLVVLIGASGAGKTTWAATHFRAGEIVSSDALRAATGTGPADMAASADAFAVLELIVTARLARRLTTVVDTVGQEPQRRRSWIERANVAGVPAIAVIMDTDPRLCAERNRGRDRRVPATVLTQQLRRMREIDAELGGEGWDCVVTVTSRADDVTPSRSVRPAEPAVVHPGTSGLGLVLQLSRFPVTDDLAGWLTSMALAADQAGFAG